MILKPKFVILDESTSALDLENEEQMYKVKEEMVKCPTDLLLSGILGSSFAAYLMVSLQNLLPLQLLQDLGMTVVSVGNRPSLVPFHDKVLRLTGEGAWKFES